eukprot:CAMPEP_0184394490 /NCGR_PEP_ID=MMETSP0007-20130409/39803_1 /TAXON_ID=97485 /ORGANISM="Prymnesium parvum, Strain Texoma1" /LENGTH=162 /DNA_ID=CAMNT_0026746065 /DNA_START=293 /DNA_END=778 /DNA_ORIENTATION=+
MTACTPTSRRAPPSPLGAASAALAVAEIAWWGNARRTSKLCVQRGARNFACGGSRSLGAASSSRCLTLLVEQLQLVRSGGEFSHVRGSTCGLGASRGRGCGAIRSTSTHGGRAHAESARPLATMLDFRRAFGVQRGDGMTHAACCILRSTHLMESVRVSCFR